ncbi:hypothetical protein FZC79_02130 [Rossellomorea vietnamensis]|uniref:Uncharacterized protein n=1 Tax=Rossellomorea vietnamensis TaxID=218284 RepID=A0A5D4KLC4_9BACI|nr:hypothetical protein [Rossellomorea vietnamensis]TYR77636.1 hypothetical protein FZC79_02130 [Rossellomorea vietnamensis]
MGKRKSSPRLATTPEKMLLLALSPVKNLLYIRREILGGFSRNSAIDRKECLYMVGYKRNKYIFSGELNESYIG